MRAKGIDPAHPGAGALVRLFHVSKSYLAGSWALRDVSVELGKGEFVFLTGPSGAGKTTLLRLIFAAERPSEGQIIVLGRNVGRLGPGGVPALRRRIGVVFPDFKLRPRRTVEENVALALEVLGTPRRLVRNKVLAMLKRVGLESRFVGGLRYTDEALGEIARRAKKEGTGARGLTGILHRLLLEDMFALPGSYTGGLMMDEAYIREKLA